METLISLATELATTALATAGSRVTIGVTFRGNRAGNHRLGNRQSRFRCYIGIEQCKTPTITERLAIAQRIVERMQGRVGNPTMKSNSGNISLIEKGQTRDIAAAKVGLGSGKTLEAAQKVVERGTPELVVCALTSALTTAALTTAFLAYRLAYRPMRTCFSCSDFKSNPFDSARTWLRTSSPRTVEAAGAPPQIRPLDLIRSKPLWRMRYGTSIRSGCQPRLRSS